MKLCSLLACSVLLFLTLPAAAQTSPTRDPQAVLLLQKSLAEVSGATAIQDVTLTGTVRRIAGSSNESGSVTLEGTAAGQSRIDVTLPSGELRQVRDLSANPWTGSWSRTSGIWHPIADHNLWTDPTWFFPGFLMTSVLSNAGYAISPVKAKNLDGVSVECITVEQEYAGSQKLPSLVQNLTKAHVCLDSQSLLPVVLAFNVHPGNNAQRNIPVRVRFSDYQVVQGAAVPYRIRRYINNGLVLDLTIETVKFNTGLSASDFTAQ